MDSLRQDAAEEDVERGEARERRKAGLVGRADGAAPRGQRDLPHGVTALRTAADERGQPALPVPGGRRGLVGRLGRQGGEVAVHDEVLAVDSAMSSVLVATSLTSWAPMFSKGSSVPVPPCGSALAWGGCGPGYISHAKIVPPPTRPPPAAPRSGRCSLVVHYNDDAHLRGMDIETPVAWRDLAAEAAPGAERPAVALFRSCSQAGDKERQRRAPSGRQWHCRPSSRNASSCLRPVGTCSTRYNIDSAPQG